MTHYLVTYATWTGATHEVAEAIAAVLREGGATADAMNARDVKSLDGYDAVVIGTSVHMGKVPKEAVRFASKHQGALGRLPVAEFIVCLTMCEDTPEHRTTALGYLDQINAAAPHMKPLEVGLFGGVVLQGTEDAKKLNPILRSMAASMAKNMRDGRDWDTIRAWANGLPEKLAARVTQM
jgi:menaquinone-dependent protoporphyrinogen oxidase